MFESFVVQENLLWCQVQVDHFDSSPNFNKREKNNTQGL